MFVVFSQGGRVYLVSVSVCQTDPILFIEQTLIFL